MKPNIIVYLSDQQRWDTMGCYGQKLDVTPNLDKLPRRLRACPHVLPRAGF